MRFRHLADRRRFRDWIGPSLGTGRRSWRFRDWSRPGFRVGVSRWIGFHPDTFNTVNGAEPAVERLVANRANKVAA